MRARKERSKTSKGAGNHRVRDAVVVICCATIIGMVAVASVSYGGFHPNHNAAKRLFALHHTAAAVTADDSQKITFTLGVVRAILNLPQSEQETLILKAVTPAQKNAQLAIINKIILEEHEEHAEGDGEHEEEHHHKKEIEEVSDFEGLGKLGPQIQHQNHGHGSHTPAQNLARRTWSVVFVTVIATCSIFFESFREILTKHTPKNLLSVIEKFFAELATLGFIGTVTFILIEFGVLSRLSLTFTGDGHILTGEFELLHFTVFFIMVLFIVVVLCLLVYAIVCERTWRAYQKEWQRAGHRDKQTGRVVDPRSLMQLPEEARLGRIQYELVKTHESQRAEFLLFRSWFILNKHNEVHIPEDFDFAKYMARSAAHILAEVLEVGVVDWCVLWGVFVLLYVVAGLVEFFGALFNITTLLQPAVALLVVVIEIGLFAGTFFLFRALLFAKAMLIPVIVTPDPAAGGAYGALESGKAPPAAGAPAAAASSGGGSAGGAKSVASSRAPSTPRPPPVALEELRAPRYATEMKAVAPGGGHGHGHGGAAEGESLLQRALGLLGEHRRANKHEQLFGEFGSHGPHLFIFFMRHLILINIIILAVTYTALFDMMESVWVGLPYVVLVMAVCTFLLTPAMVGVYTWCCSVEQLKRRDIMLQVLREQKHERVVEIVRSLSMLSFFIDQMELLAKIGESGGDARGKVTEAQWRALLESTDPKEVEELEALFDSFDADKSGELEEEEVTGLLQHYLGTPMSAHDAAGVFRVMDADGSGAVDFREFATVVLHLKAERAKQVQGGAGFEDLGERMFKIFDKTGDGVVSEEEVVRVVERMGRNWDTGAVRYLFSQMDRDGSGEVNKAEFIAYIRKIQAELSL